MKENVWAIENEKKVLETRIMTVMENLYRSPDGAPHSFYVMEMPNWCNIIPITADGQIVMIRQYRPGTNEQTLEIPGGVLDPEEDPQTAALRELEEETGYAPLPGARCQKLGWTHPNPAIQNNRCYSFVVGPVVKKGKQNLDPGERIEVIEVPIAELPRRILGGEITHALMLNTFFWASLMSAGGVSGLTTSLAAFES